MAETQKFMGRNSLVKRLSAQVGSRNLAENILRKRGDMKSSSDELTSSGRKRNAMTAAERAKDRSVKRNGGKTSDYSYSAKTNYARKK